VEHQELIYHRYDWLEDCRMPVWGGIPDCRTGLSFGLSLDTFPIPAIG
jgi:hypothetical protein